MPPLAMDDDGRVLRKGTQVVGLNFMLVLLGVVSRHLSARVSPRLFDGAAFAEKVGAFQSAVFIGRSEDQAITEVEGEYAGFFPTQWRDERS